MSATALQALMTEVVSLRAAVAELAALLRVGDAADLVSASEADRILHLRTGTVREAALAGQIPYSPRKARRGAVAVYVSMAAARRIWGPR